MLMQNFKAAADLQITEAQKDALCKTLVLFETGRMKHEPRYSEAEFFNPTRQRDVKFTGGFNMNDWSLEHSCGTISCIAGTAEIISGVDFGDYQDNKGLVHLFTPNDMDASKWPSITPTQAAVALRSYLTTGAPNWAEAIKLKHTGIISTGRALLNNGG